MRIKNLNRCAPSICALSVSIAAAMLADCGGPQSPIDAPGVMPQSYAIGTHVERSGSWMMPEKADGKSILLYVGDSNGFTVSVYDYATGYLVGTLNGFDSPAGGCVDAVGDIFIANQGDSTTLEFRNGGTKPIHRYRAQEGWSGVGCSVNREGDLAVSLQPLSSGKASLCVWKAGRERSTCYTDDDCGTMASPGYDATGNLYVEGYYYGPAVCELPIGGHAMRTVKITAEGLGNGGVMWDGRHLTLAAWPTGSQQATSIYRVAESPSGDLAVIGTTVLTDTCNNDSTDVPQPFIIGRKNTPVNDRESRTVVGPDYECYAVPIDFWHYPRGGSPSKAWPQTFFPGGVVVSIGART